MNRQDAPGGVYAPLAVFYGGTFDPVHLGHIHLASLARNALDLDEIRFLPCRISPLKTVNATASSNSNNWD